MQILRSVFQEVMVILFASIGMEAGLSSQEIVVRTKRGNENAPVSKGQRSVPKQFKGKTFTNTLVAVGGVLFFYYNRKRCRYPTSNSGKVQYILNSMMFFWYGKK